MTAAVAKNLIGDLLANNAVVRITSDGANSFTVEAQPPAGQEITAGQVQTLANRYSVSALVPSARFI